MHASAIAHRSIVLVAVVLVVAAVTAVPQPAGSEETLVAELVVAKDDDPPGAIRVAEDRTVLFADVDGPVWRLDPDATEPHVVHRPPVVRGPEWGIVGLAFAPGFTETGEFFMTYMTGPPGVRPSDMDVRGETRVVRVEGGVETSVYTYPATRFHNSGRILVHDGLLYLSRGEQNDRPQSQDPENPAGNILRMTLDGDPAPGNPFGDRTYSFGHRNPFGLAWDEVRGVLVESEVGNTANEEVNVIVPGGNYGWPRCEGPCDPPREEMIDPIVTYEEVITPTGLTVVGGDYYHGSFNRGSIHRVFETPEGWRTEVVYVHPRGLVVDVAASPDGEWLYFGSWDGLWRIPTPSASRGPEEGVDLGAPDRGIGTNDTPPPRSPPDEAPEEVTPGAWWRQTVVAVGALVAAGAAVAAAGLTRRGLR